MPTGAGYAPAGTSSAGYGVPDSAAVPNNAILPAILTGLPQTGRSINPQTGDYVFTTDGRLMGMDTVPQLVILALTTTLGSSVLPTLGQAFTLIREQGPNFSQQLTATVNAALADLVRRKFVAVKSVTVQQPPSNPDAGTCLVKWTDLTTGLSYTNTVGQ
jgi:hypothetical protein